MYLHAPAGFEWQKLFWTHYSNGLNYINSDVADAGKLWFTNSCLPGLEDEWRLGSHVVGASMKNSLEKVHLYGQVDFRSLIKEINSSPLRIFGMSFNMIISYLLLS